MCVMIIKIRAAIFVAWCCRGCRVCAPDQLLRHQRPATTRRSAHLGMRKAQMSRERERERRSESACVFAWACFKLLTSVVIPKRLEYGMLRPECWDVGVSQY